MDISELKYLMDGQAVFVERLLDNGALVRRVYENYGEEPFTDDTILFVEKIFDIAPTHKQDARLSKLRAEIDELMETRKTLLAEIQAAKDSESSRLIRYNQYKQLKHLDAFLDGKITHYAIKDWASWKIEDRNCVNQDRPRHVYTKLLCLHGKSDGNLEWNLYRYPDGSGSSEVVFPCCSYEEALAVVREDLSVKTELREYDIHAAEKYGIILDKDALASYQEKRRKFLSDRVDEKAKELGKAKRELDAADRADMEYKQERG